MIASRLVAEEVKHIAKLMENFENCKEALVQNAVLGPSPDFYGNDESFPILQEDKVKIELTEHNECNEHNEHNEPLGYLVKK